MVISKEFFVYGVKDSHGNTWMIVPSEPEDTIRVHNLRDKNDRFLHFRGESYLFPVWCMENGLQCIVTKRTIEVEFPE